MPITTPTPGLSRRLRQRVEELSTSPTIPLTEFVVSSANPFAEPLESLHEKRVRVAYAKRTDLINSIRKLLNPDLRAYYQPHYKRGRIPMYSLKKDYIMVDAVWALRPEYDKFNEHGKFRYWNNEEFDALIKEFVPPVDETKV